MTTDVLDRETELRRAALDEWGDCDDITPEEVDRLKHLEPALQEREIEARGYVFVCEFVNHYRCEDCDEDWSDAWCCCCDDECPTCGVDHSPEESEVVGVEILRLKHDPCTVCGQVHDF